MLKEYFSQISIVENQKPKLLLHICCAPDLIVPLLDLKESFKLYLAWYNPNIQPYSEYSKRHKEYLKLLKLESWDYEIIEDTYDPREFYDKLFKHRWLVWYKDFTFKESMKEFSTMKEKDSPRCDLCYYIRLLHAWTLAEKYDISYFTTTLLISPKKAVDKLDKYWKIVSKQVDSKYLSFNFRKNDWFKRASDYTRDNWIWRQNYCWCMWAKNWNSN